MATTPNLGLPLYDQNDTSELDVLLNGQSTALDTNLKAQLDELQAQMPQDSGWVVIPSFVNGFSANPVDRPRYRKIGQQVFLSGHLYRSTAPGTSSIVNAFTLPPGFRPQSQGWMSTLNVWGVCVGWETDGDVGVMSSLARTTNPGYPLDGISWIAA